MRTTAPVIFANPELEQLRQLVAGARARLAELEASFTKEKSRVDVMQAVCSGNCAGIISSATGCG